LNQFSFVGLTKDVAQISKLNVLLDKLGPRFKALCAFLIETQELNLVLAAKFGRFQWFNPDESEENHYFIKNQQHNSIIAEVNLHNLKDQILIKFHQFLIIKEIHAIFTIHNDKHYNFK